MATFNALTLDRLLEPRVSRSVDKTDSNLQPSISKPSMFHLKSRNSALNTESKVLFPQMSPELYATPETTSLPDSPSSFPTSPYIINHKGRGPRLAKSCSNNDISSHFKALDEEKADGFTKDGETKVSNIIKSSSLTCSFPEPLDVERVNGFNDNPTQKKFVSNGNETLLGGNNILGEYDGGHVISKAELRAIAVNSYRDNDSDDFYDPKDSMSLTSSSQREYNAGAESSVQSATSVGEFYDAWEDLLSESGSHSSYRDTDAELREMKVSLLMEIDSRKQAEEALGIMRIHWQNIRQQFAQVGLTLPADPTVAADGDHLDLDPAEELAQQLHVTRFVSESIGRGTAKAEKEAEMEAITEAKNFEIRRLSDRLNYSEAVNREMSQRNQEAIEMARHDRRKRRRRQKLVWGTIAAAITLGTATLAWSYLPLGKESSSYNSSRAPEHNDVA